MYKFLIENKKVVCFDLDGTIAKTEPYYVLAFREVLEKQDTEVFYSDVYGVVGEPLKDKWKRVINEGHIKGKVNVDELVSSTNQAFLRLFKESDLEPVDGFWELLFKLKEEHHIQVALATNTLKEVATQVMQKLEIENAFEYVIFGDDVKHKKPNPEIYLKAAQHFNIKPEEMLIFEDSIIGSAAAEKSGADLLILWDGQTDKKLFPAKTKYFLLDFADLANSIDTTAEEELENFKKRVEEDEKKSPKPKSYFN